MQAVRVERGCSQCFISRGAQLLDLDFFEVAISVVLPHLIPLKLEPFCGTIFLFEASVAGHGVVWELRGYLPVNGVLAGVDGFEEKIESVS